MSEDTKMDILEDILYPALDEAKENIETAKTIKATPDSILFGSDGMDSLGLVQYIVLVEEKVADLTGLEITLASDKAMSRNRSPFLNLKVLGEFVDELLKEEGYHG